MSFIVTSADGPPPTHEKPSSRHSPRTDTMMAAEQPRTRLALLNLRYSPNLGDVLLCECLEYGLRKAAPQLDVVQLDIAGRRDFAQGSARRLAAMAMLQRLPQPVRQRIARLMIGRSLRRTEPYWQAQLATVNAAVVGGGGLFADADLNFPLKIAAILSVVAAFGLPAAVHAVGVSDNWSPEGEALFRQALTNVTLVHATVRDELSRAIWTRRLAPAGVRLPDLARDPGFLAAECYPAAPRRPQLTQQIGICLTHPTALRYHADAPMPPAAALGQWFAALVAAFTTMGCAVFLFTTGSPEDEAYASDVTPRLLAAVDPAGSATRVPRFARAAELVGFIATLDLLIAHRLHACIAAYSFAVPHIGLTWDVKMRSYFELVQRTPFLRDAVATSVDNMVALAQETTRAGIAPAEHAAVMRETHGDIAALLAKLTATPT